tara:strand:- start:4977 stop:6269 length:1293 start_codon:yes stop_codon:yes gene_type:complete
MKLSEIRDYIGNILDYQPNITSYQNQLTDVINENYFRLFTEKPFTFAQKEAIVSANKDDSLVTIGVTNGSPNITNVAAQFTSTMPGQVIVLDDVEYTVAWVSTSNLAYLTSNYTGATATLATATVKYRYLDMPQDCVEIMQVLKRAMTLTPQEPGRMVPITRYEDEYWNLPLNEVNIPRYWVPYDDYSLIPPKAPTITITTSGTGRGARTLEFAVSYVFAGRESALSSVTSVTLTDGQFPSIVIPAIPNTSGMYRRVYVRCPDAGINKFYNIPEAGSALTEFLPTSAGTFSYDTVTNLSAFTSSDVFELTYTAYNGVDGNIQRIRMYPRQDQTYSLTVRHMYRPKRLIDDADTPELPSANHQVLAYMSLRDIFIKHDNNAQAAMYDRKVAQEMLKIEQRYLTSIAKRYIKQFMPPNRTGSVPLYTPLIQN